jgi:hypothetical protein
MSAGDLARLDRCPNGGFSGRESLLENYLVAISFYARRVLAQCSLGPKYSGRKKLDPVKKLEAAPMMSINFDPQ